MKTLLLFSAIFLALQAYCQEVDLSQVHVVQGVVTYVHTDGRMAEVTIGLGEDKDVHAAYISLNKNEMTLLKSDRSPMMKFEYETYSLRFTNNRSKVKIQIEGIIN